MIYQVRKYLHQRFRHASCYSMGDLTSSRPLGQARLTGGTECMDRRRLPVMLSS